MREIVVVQQGQCGNNIGSCFWESILRDHQITYDGKIDQCKHHLSYPDVYFKQSSTDQYVPRAVLTDINQDALYNIRNQQIGAMFSPHNYIFANSTTGNNFAQAYNGIGRNLSAMVFDAMRNEAEACDSLQGFQMVHSINGGFGSGMNALLLEHILDEYPDCIIQCQSMAPSGQFNDIVIEPYNAILGLNSILEHATQDILIDNQSLFEICSMILKIPTPGFIEINSLVAMSMAGTTSGFRFPGQVNCDLRKQCTNLIPFPNIKFLSSSISPLDSIMCEPEFYNTNVKELTHQLFDPNRQFCTIKNPDYELKYLTASIQYRGIMSSKEVDQESLFTIKKNNNLFVEWIHENIQTSICSVALPQYPLSAMLLANNLGISKKIGQMREQLAALLQRRAYLHKYLEHGMSMDDIQQAVLNIEQLVSSYIQSSDKEYNDE